MSFGILIFILTKFAWKPITAALKEREDSIHQALQAAEQARLQMDALKNDNEKLLREARAERDQILKEAREIKDSIVNKAQKEGDEMKKKLVAEAADAINKEKQAAMMELKAQVATLSVDIAEKILRKQLEKTPEQQDLINDNLKNLTLN
jgi:F-type H+-transporting ATPase subunit b